MVANEEELICLHLQSTPGNYQFTLTQLIAMNVDKTLALYFLKKMLRFLHILLPQLVILGGIAMTVFLRTKMSHEDYEGGVIYLGVLFLGLVTHLFNGFAELAMSIVKLPIYYKQRDYCFYPSWIYALPTWVLKIPISFVECAVWIAMTYYGIGFDPNIGR